jgi:hypothetical protein
VTDQGLEHYIGAFAPGGHPPMIDLMQDPDLGEVLRHFHTEAKRTVALAQLDQHSVSTKVRCVMDPVVLPVASDVINAIRGATDLRRRWRPADLHAECCPCR